jgi:MFS family permease
MHKIVKILLLSSIIYNFSVGLLGPIYAIFVQRIGGDILSASTAWAIYAITIGVLTIVFGKFEEILSWSRMLLWGRILTTVGIAGYLFVRNPLNLFVVQFVLGVASAMKDPAYDSLFSKFVTKKKVSLEWGYQWGFTSISTGISALVGGLVATIYGFRVLFVLMTISSAISAIVAGFLLKKKTLNELFDIIHHH